MTPGLLRAHYRQHVFAGHHHAAQVDADDAVEGFFADRFRRRVAAGKRNADVVMQDVDAAPRLLRVRDHVLHRRLARHIGREGLAFAF